MQLTSTGVVKYTFSGHDSFQCRQFWLKKGYDFIQKGLSFNDDNAVVNLGVGKNMVSSIRYWLKAFEISDNKDNLTEFGRMLLANEGFDPFLEDDGSLWLLHYHLVKSNVSSIYNLIFNEYRREKIEFNRDSFISYMKRKSESLGSAVVNLKTVADDFDVFRKMYFSSQFDKSNEDGFSGLLSELNIVRKVEKRSEGKREDYFTIENLQRSKIPVEVFLYSILENKNMGSSINLNSLEHDFNGPGSIFAMNKAGIIEKIVEAQSRYPWISYNDHAGIKEIQFKEKPDPYSLLADYYYE